ncbi:MAG: hypothetical protein HZC01_01365 [Candidatus Kerfeldbacteria bacterium]|nr:hypothetical protein [Candidatus Kerfeldbacteria bacterium]
MFPEEWDTRSSGFPDYDAYLESLGYDLRTISAFDYEHAYERPYREGLFRLSLAPGFVEVLRWTRHNGYFTTGNHEQLDWRAEYIQKHYHLDIRDYFTYRFSTFDYGNTNVKTSTMLVDVLRRIVAKKFSEVVYTDDRKQNCQFFLKAVQQARQQGVAVPGRAYHLTTAAASTPHAITPVRDLYGVKEAEKHLRK